MFNIARYYEIPSTRLADLSFFNFSPRHQINPGESFKLIGSPLYQANKLGRAGRVSHFENLSRAGDFHANLSPKLKRHISVNYGFYPKITYPTLNLRINQLD